jgi:hypothetical protein
MWKPFMFYATGNINFSDVIMLRTDQKGVRRGEATVVRNKPEFIQCEEQDWGVVPGRLDEWQKSICFLTLKGPFG